MERIKKVLVSGASGLLGYDLLPILARDFDIIGITRSHPLSVKPDRVRVSRCDLSQRGAVKKIVSLEPEVIVHAAALSDVDFCQLYPREAQRHNVEATKNVVEAAKKLDCKLIYLSTDHVFDGKKKVAYREIDKPNPINIYGETKLKAENIIKRELKNFLIIRVSWLFGSLKRGFLKFVLERANKLKSINIVSDKISLPTYTVDLSYALNFLIHLDSFRGDIFHFTNSGRGCSWFEFAKHILRCAGLTEVEVKPITLSELKLPAPRPENSVLDNSKFLKIYGRPVRTWQEALADCFRRRLPRKEGVS